jgi:dUTP pyrophosphatase
VGKDGSLMPSIAHALLKKYGPYPHKIWRYAPMALCRDTQIVRGQGAELPSYSTEGAAGLDLRANESGILYPGNLVIVGTGLKIRIPKGTALLILPRSGLACKSGITVANSPGLIDEDYTVEIKVCLYNISNEQFVFVKGDRIAQAVAIPYFKLNFTEVGELEETDRGDGGFGSSGVR